MFANSNPNSAVSRSLKFSELKVENVLKPPQRPQDVEAVFGNIKQNKGFWRFMLSGLNKVEIEIGLLSLAHNLNKVAIKIAKEMEKSATFLSKLQNSILKILMVILKNQFKLQMVRVAVKDH